MGTLHQFFPMIVAAVLVVIALAGYIYWERVGADRRRDQLNRGRPKTEVRFFTGER